jgi:hypothetical protein
MYIAESGKILDALGQHAPANDTVTYVIEEMLWPRDSEFFEATLDFRDAKPPSKGR